MIAGILQEPQGENRVSLLPEQVEVLIKKNVQVVVEANAGNNASAFNDAFTSKGATIASRAEVLESNLVLSINPLTDADMQQVKEGTVLLGVYQPLFNFQQVKNWADKNISTFSLDMIPRTTRAQSMDVLSSQANIAGYKAVLLASTLLPRYFPMFMTAAGSIAPAKVLILGAGVAGLQAIATAKRLGALVCAFDVRKAAKEQVQSLGAKFIEVAEDQLNDSDKNASNSPFYANEMSLEYQKKQQELLLEKTKLPEDIIKAILISNVSIPIEIILKSF